VGRTRDLAISIGAFLLVAALLYATMRFDGFESMVWWGFFVSVFTIFFMVGAPYTNWKKLLAWLGCVILPVAIILPAVRELLGFESMVFAGFLLLFAGIIALTLRMERLVGVRGK